MCQTCIFDLDFGLPVELRDKFIEQNELVVMPADGANRDFWANKMNANIDKLDLPYNNAEVKTALSQIARKHNGDMGRGLGGSKAAKRNAAHVCSFFVKGTCNRGVTCPYRHSNITEQDLEDYECEPAQYIKNDLEESDAETRRRICMKFVTKLS